MCRNDCIAFGVQIKSRGGSGFAKVSKNHRGVYSTQFAKPFKGKKSAAAINGRGLRDSKKRKKEK